MQTVHEAGGRAREEQIVMEYLAHKSVRADIVASHGPAAPRIYYDVVVAHPFTTGVPTGSCGELISAEPCADAAVRPAERRKRNDYSPPLVPDTMISAVKIVPIAFDTHGRWGQAAADELKVWARRRLQQADARRSIRPRGIYQAVLAHWRAKASCLLQRGNFHVYSDCIGIGVSSEPGPDNVGLTRCGGAFASYLTCGPF